MNMVSTKEKRSLCQICNKASSVFFCRGCQQDFCSIDAKEHRQELSKQLDTIILEHDQLRQNLTEYNKNSNKHPLLQQIDQWETESMNKIRRAAEDARKQLLNAVTDHITEITKDLENLTQELATARSEDNFIEIDLKDWMKSLEKYTKDLLSPFSINIQQKINSTPFIQELVVILQKDEFFKYSTEKMRIDENGQVIVAKIAGHSTARCHGEYSSGQYKFRFMFEQKHPSNWIFFGIVSKAIPIQEDSYSTPTTFGWTTHNFVIRDDPGTQGYNHYRSDIEQHDTIELFLDCNRHIIRLTNERTGSQNELNVDLTKCPFPWQLHFGLHHQNDRIRYLGS